MKYIRLSLLAVAGLILLAFACPTMADSRDNAAADASLVSIWTDQSGNFSNKKANSMSVDAVRQALDAGADVNATANDGTTALIAASRWGLPQVVKLLLDAGADKEAKDSKVGDTALLHAAAHGHADVVKQLLDAGADKEATNKYGVTALIIAAGHGYADVVTLLLDAKANIEVKDTRGGTALSNAAKQGHTDVVKLLLDAGADMDATNSALIIASSRGYAGMVKLLLDAGANKEVTNKFHATPLIIAAGHEFVDTVKVLLDAGANRNATDNRGRTAIDRANNPAAPLPGQESFIADKAATIALLEGVTYAGAPTDAAPPAAANVVASAPSADDTSDQDDDDGSSVSADSVFAWTDVPQDQMVPLQGATFDAGGYQFVDTVGETIIIPFANDNLYVLRFAVSNNENMYLVNDGGGPILFLPLDGYLLNATVDGARWYPFSPGFNPAGPVYIGLAPSWNLYTGMGWYPGMSFAGGYWYQTSSVDIVQTTGFFILIDGRYYHDWRHYHNYYRRHPGWRRPTYFRRDFYSWARNRRAERTAFGAVTYSSAARPGGIVRTQPIRTTWRPYRTVVPNGSGTRRTR